MSRAHRTALLPAEWRASASLSGVYALRMLGMFLVLPVLALYAKELPGSTPGSGGLAIAVYGLTQALFQLPLGMLSDKLGRKKVIYLGLVVFALGSFIAAAADSVTWLLIGRAIQGAGAVSAAVTALLADLTRDEVRTRAMASIGLTIGLTFAASMVASPLLTRYLGVPGLFALTGGLCVLALGVVAWITPNPQRGKFHEDAEMQTSRIGEVLHNKRLMQLNFGIFALQAVMMAVFASLPIVMRGLGLPKEQHWQLYLPAVLLGLLLMVPAIVVGETRNKLKQVFVAGIALIAAALCGIYTGQASLLAIGISLVVYFVGFNILEASLPSIVSKVAPTDLKGTAMGMYNTAQSIGVFVGGAAGGRLFEHFGFIGVFSFSMVLTLVWLLMAAAAPAPAAVRNLALSISPIWQGCEERLLAVLQQFEGVEAASLSADRSTVYIKARQQGFDEAAAKQIILGGNHVE